MNKRFTLINVNCRSIVCKATQLEGLLLTYDVEIAALTETWLGKNIFDSEFVPQNYKVFRKDRDGRGGGVAILFKSSLQVFRMPDIDDVEGIFCKFYKNNVRYVLGAVYRPPNSSVALLVNLKKYIERHIKQNDRLMLTGDFNLPNIDWTAFSHSNNIIEQTMLDISIAFDLLQVVKDPTRVHNGSYSILDLFFVNGTVKENVECYVTTGISDHKAVVLTLINANFDRRNTVGFFPNFSRAHDESILDMLDFHYDRFMNFNGNVNDLWLFFKSVVFQCIERFVPKIAKKSPKCNPWITRETLRSQRKLKRMKKRLKAGNYSQTIIDEQTEKLKQLIAHDKEKYFSTQLPTFIKTCPEKFWRQITPASRSHDTFKVNGICERDDALVSTAFNDYFKSVFTQDDSSLPCYSVNLPSIPDVVISEAGVLNLLLKLDVKKSPGPDDIPNAFLKRYAEWCAKYLCILFNKSLNEGSLPDDWRTARIKPIHKTGDKASIQNYRPISLTSTACKVLEHIIHKHIADFLEQNNFLTNAQHGFRRGFSTATQLVQTIHDFAQAINEGKQTDAIFMDFKKAFDKVSHNKLLHKLGNVLKNDKLLAWITAYLRNRRQFVVVNNSPSPPVPVDSGVPQGSVLGPLLFLIFINDIVDNISVSVRLYADDCVLYEKITTTEDQVRLNNDFTKIITWCDQWQMCVNYDKTVFMRITQKKKPLLFNYTAKNKVLSQVNTYKYLGLRICNNLSWTEHIDNVTANALRKLFFLRRALKLGPPSVRSLSYNTIIRPMLEYAVIIWDPFTKSNIAKLDRVRKKAARFIYNSYNRTSITALLNQSGLLPVSHRNRICRLKFLFQLIKGQYNIDTSNIISFSSGYNTRQRHDFTVTPLNARNNTFKYSFFPRTITDWNNLTNDAVTQTSLKRFESHL